MKYQRVRLRQTASAKLEQFTKLCDEYEKKLADADASNYKRIHKILDNLTIRCLKLHRKVHPELYQ